MADLLQLRDGHKSYEDKILLRAADLRISDNDRMGLIGRNGCGKSTLCRIFLGEESLDQGEVWRHPSARIGYLRQHDEFGPGETVEAFLMRDTGESQWRCGEAAGRLGLKGDVLASPVDHLSGGMRMRVKLAALSLGDTNILILDEPTNFLDLRTRVVMERFLREYRGAFVIVSHDRAFLNRICTSTVELSRGRATRFDGKVDAYLEYRAEAEARLIKSNELVRAEKRRLQDWVDRHRANASTASQARSKAKQLARLEEQELDAPEQLVHLRLPKPERRSGTALRCVNLEIGYPEVTVASGIGVEIEHGARVAVVGDNGQGKTTFLRTATQSLEPVAGAVKWSHGCVPGVYAQHVYASLSGERMVADHLYSCAAEGVSRQDVLNVAGGFLFSGNDLQKPVRVLSGGERARLCLAGLLLGRKSVLVLDEPVTHLDVETADALAAALEQFPGTVLFASHDRRFITRVATHVLEVRDGRVANYPGDFALYLYRVEQDDRESADPEMSQKAKAAPKKKRALKRRKANPQRLAALDKQIEELEGKRCEIEAQLATITDYTESHRVADELAKVVASLQEKEDEWLLLQDDGE